MNKGRLIGGTICLTLAALLGALNFTLSADEQMFMVGEENVPWLPAVILGGVGIVLLATARGRAQTPGSGTNRGQIATGPDHAALNKHLETIGWGCFFIMLGGFMLVPQTVVDRGFWSIGVGVIMLGLNAARYTFKIRMSGFTTFLGLISLVGGILQLAGMKEFEGAFLLIILGSLLLLRPWFDKRKLFGKAEEA